MAPGVPARLTLQKVKEFAISASLSRPTTLRRAIARLGFVQADPIRSPARAQDLILRHRVAGYRVGDLEAKYPSLEIEEDFLYAYGFMTKATWGLLHPREEKKLSLAEKRVLEIVSSHRQIHPRDLELHLGKERELNAWGGYSKSTTRVLQALHYRGLLRVSGRENGIRLYAESARERESLEPDERLRRLVLRITGILAPISERSLRATLRLPGHVAPQIVDRQATVTALLKSGDLASSVVDGVNYLWPADMPVRGKADSKVRFLAPFDPIVWDRRRFEHFWGWPYRFEAYTPPAKRTMGYYAMPLLWGVNVIGWVNLSKHDQRLIADPGFVGDPPKDAAFRTEFDAEVNRFQEFLGW